MEKIEVIKSIGKRTGGDIYLGVVGAVRTGKSTFIRKFMENLVIPNIEDEYERKRCLDELPQAAAGKNNNDNRAKIRSRYCCQNKSRRL